MMSLLKNHRDRETEVIGVAPSEAHVWVQGYWTYPGNSLGVELGTLGNASPCKRCLDAGTLGREIRNGKGWAGLESGSAGYWQ